MSKSDYEHDPDFIECGNQQDIEDKICCTGLFEPISIKAQIDESSYGAINDIANMISNVLCKGIYDPNEFKKCPNGDISHTFLGDLIIFIVKELGLIKNKDLLIKIIRHLEIGEDDFDSFDDSNLFPTAIPETSIDVVDVPPANSGETQAKEPKTDAKTEDSKSGAEEPSTGTIAEKPGPETKVEETKPGEPVAEEPAKSDSLVSKLKQSGLEKLNSAKESLTQQGSDKATELKEAAIEKLKSAASGNANKLKSMGLGLLKRHKGGANYVQTGGGRNTYCIEQNTKMVDNKGFVIKNAIINAVFKKFTEPKYIYFHHIIRKIIDSFEKLVERPAKNDGNDCYENIIKTYYNDLVDDHHLTQVKGGALVDLSIIDAIIANNVVIDSKTVDVETERYNKTHYCDFSVYGNKPETTIDEYGDIHDIGAGIKLIRSEFDKFISDKRNVMMVVKTIVSKIIALSSGSFSSSRKERIIKLFGDKINDIFSEYPDTPSPEQGALVGGAPLLAVAARGIASKGVKALAKREGKSFASPGSGSGAKSLFGRAKDLYQKIRPSSNQSIMGKLTSSIATSTPIGAEAASFTALSSNTATSTPSTSAPSLSSAPPASTPTGPTITLQSGTNIIDIEKANSIQVRTYLINYIKTQYRKLYKEVRMDIRQHMKDNTSLWNGLVDHMKKSIDENIRSFFNKEEKKKYLPSFLQCIIRPIIDDYNHYKEKDARDSMIGFIKVNYELSLINITKLKTGQMYYVQQHAYVDPRTIRGLASLFSRPAKPVPRRFFGKFLGMKTKRYDNPLTKKTEKANFIEFLDLNFGGKVDKMSTRTTRRNLANSNVVTFKFLTEFDLLDTLGENLPYSIALLTDQHIAELQQRKEITFDNILKSEYLQEQQDLDKPVETVAYVVDKPVVAVAHVADKPIVEDLAAEPIVENLDKPPVENFDKIGLVGGGFVQTGFSGEMVLETGPDTSNRNYTLIKRDKIGDVVKFVFPDQAPTPKFTLPPGFQPYGIVTFVNDAGFRTIQFYIPSRYFEHPNMDKLLKHYQFTPVATKINVYEYSEQIDYTGKPDIHKIFDYYFYYQSILKSSNGEPGSPTFIFKNIQNNNDAIIQKIMEIGLHNNGSSNDADKNIYNIKEGLGSLYTEHFGLRMFSPENIFVFQDKVGEPAYFKLNHFYSSQAYYDNNYPIENTYFTVYPTQQKLPQKSTTLKRVGGSRSLQKRKKNKNKHKKNKTRKLH